MRDSLFDGMGVDGFALGFGDRAAVKRRVAIQVKRSFRGAGWRRLGDFQGFSNSRGRG